MIRKAITAAVWAVVSSVMGTACDAGGVGDPCTPEDEYDPQFAGYDVTEVSTESGSLQCQTRLCLINHFEGRVSCPYGQTQEMLSGQPPRPEREYCHIPGTAGEDTRVRAPARAQRRARPAADAVYCSCRCNGPDPDAPYCSCPSGYECIELVPHDVHFDRKELEGSYCVKTGTAFQESIAASPACTVDDPTATPPGACGTFDGRD